MNRIERLLEDNWFKIPYGDKDMEAVRQIAIQKIKNCLGD